MPPKFSWKGAGFGGDTAVVPAWVWGVWTLLGPPRATVHPRRLAGAEGQVPLGPTLLHPPPQAAACGHDTWPHWVLHERWEWMVALDSVQPQFTEESFLRQRGRVPSVKPTPICKTIQNSHV